MNPKKKSSNGVSEVLNHRNPLKTFSRILKYINPQREQYDHIPEYSLLNKNESTIK